MPVPQLALQTHLLHFDRLSAAERQPCSFAADSVLTFDGRLDNRDDLLVTLDRILGSDHSDAALATAAYERWGLDAFARMVGDWSLVLWDSTQHALVMASDYMGTRPLFYHTTPARFIWATRLEALAACANLYSQPDDDYIAAELTGAGPAPDITPFKDAYRLRAGHQFVIRRYGDTPRRYWTFAPASIRVPSLAAYADQLRILLTDAVRLRLRAQRRVWAHLSGGWDSSSVVCLADILTRRGVVEARAIQPVSLLHSLAQESDEEPYIVAVERWRGLQTVRQEIKHHVKYSSRLGHLLPYHWLEVELLQAPVRAAGDRIVLSGYLGDLIMGRTAPHALALLEPLQAGHPLRFLRLAVDRSRHTRQPLLRSLAKLMYSAYAPNSLQRLGAGRQTQVAKLAQASKLQGLTPNLLARHMALSKPDYPSTAAFPRLTRRLANAFYAATDSRALISEGSSPAVWCTHPFSHRPLVEFVLAAPLGALWAPTVARAGMQRALSNVLPPEILTRSGKGTLNTALDRLEPERTADLATSDVLPRDVAHWHLVRRGYVLGDVLARSLADVRAGTAASPLLLRGALLEVWLISLATKSSSLVPPTSSSDVQRGAPLQPVGPSHAPNTLR